MLLLLLLLLLFQKYGTDSYHCIIAAHGFQFCELDVGQSLRTRSTSSRRRSWTCTNWNRNPSCYSKQPTCATQQKLILRKLTLVPRQHMSSFKIYGIYDAGLSMFLLSWRQPVCFRVWIVGCQGILCSLQGLSGSLKKYVLGAQIILLRSV